MDVLFSLIVAVLFGALTVAVQRGLFRGVSPTLGAMAPTAIALLVAMTITLCSLPFGDAGDTGNLWRFALAGLISPGLSQIVFTHAVRDAGSARVGILIGMAPVLSAVLAITVLEEPFRPGIVVATLMIVVGGIALAVGGERPKDFKLIGLVFGALASVCVAVQAIVTRWASNGTGVSPLFAALAVLGTGTLVLVGYILVTPRRASLREIWPAVVAFLPAGILFGLAYIGFMLAYRFGRVIIVAPLTATQSLWTVAFAILLIGRQREAIGPRIFVSATLVVVGGAIVGAVG